jgi:hypothetical protein
MVKMMVDILALSVMSPETSLAMTLPTPTMEMSSADWEALNPRLSATGGRNVVGTNMAAITAQHNTLKSYWMRQTYMQLFQDLVMFIVIQIHYQILLFFYDDLCVFAL